MKKKILFCFESSNIRKSLRKYFHFRFYSNGDRCGIYHIFKRALEKISFMEFKTNNYQKLPLIAVMKSEEAHKIQL